MLNVNQRVTLSLTVFDRVSGMQAHQDTNTGIRVISMVSACPAIERICAGATIEFVIAAVAIEGIVATKTVQDIVAVATVYRIGARRAGEGVVVCKPVEYSVTRSVRELPGYSCQLVPSLHV